jgi:hypothetical protein
MDTFGSVDPYALIFFESLEYRTQTVKGSYTPEWNETFTFLFNDPSKAVRSDFCVRVNDWDATSKDDEVGSFTIPASRMSEIVRAKIGWEGQETFTLYREGKGVVGQDKELSEITVKVSIIEVPKAFAALEADADGCGQRRLQVTLVSAKHLPKVMLYFVCVQLLHLQFSWFYHQNQTALQMYLTRHFLAFPCETALDICILTSVCAYFCL